MNILFQSDRLLFRNFTADDAALIYELNSDPEVLKYVHELPPADNAAALGNLVNRILPQYKHYGYGRWAVYRKDEHDFIGWCGLKYRPERAEVDLGYRFVKTAWGHGYATEAALACIDQAFDTYHLTHLAAMAHVDNLASLRVLEKAGMQFVGYETVDNWPVKTYRLFNPRLLLS